MVSLPCLIYANFFYKEVSYQGIEHGTYLLYDQEFIITTQILIFVVVVAYFILSRLLYLVFSANLGLLCMLHPGMECCTY